MSTSRAAALKQTAIMVAVFYALDKFSLTVLWSAFAGATVVMLNHLFLVITVELAADRAEKGDPEAAKRMVSLSSVIRLICMGAAILLFVKLEGNVIALVLPLAFSRPVLMVTEFFRKKGD